MRFDKEITPRHATLADIYHSRTGIAVDKCIFVYYQAPHSFTGEDVVEFNIHGSKAVLKLLLDSLSSVQGLRFAEPGEFAMRAVFNGKLDLLQAEGLADLIDAETIQQQELALKQLEGEMSKTYEHWRQQLIKIMSLMEAHIDFPEDELPEDLVKRASDEVHKLNQEIIKHLHHDHRGERLRDGMYVAIIGQTNAGKSSLMNKLAKRDVAIVSNIEGTTRDVIEVHLELAGYPIILADTAGLRESLNEIENEGMKRSLERASRAACKLIVLDATLQIQPENILNLIDENTIVVLNKTDMVTPQQLTFRSHKALLLSAKEGLGLDTLISSLTEFTERFFSQARSSPLITRQRHRENLTRCSECLSNFTLSQNTIECAAEDLRMAASSLGKITGTIDIESMLDKIFSSFCIGK
jgi:tRNA modification GTPase